MTNPTPEQIEERLRHAAQQSHEKQREAERALHEAVDENAALKAKITQWENWQANDQGLEAAKTQEIRSLRKALNLRREVPAAGVNPDWIKDQRTSNWPDMHPEDFCHKCGTRNPAWAAEPNDWGTATASWAAETGREGICCVTCFVDMHRAETGEYSLWVLKRVGQEGSHPESSDSSTAAFVTPAGVTPREPGEPHDCTGLAVIGEIESLKQLLDTQRQRADFWERRYKEATQVDEARLTGMILGRTAPVAARAIAEWLRGGGR